MAAPGGGGDGFDFCEYVYNPLMRQYQAMMRLMQMLRDSQNADCNDIQCFTDPNDPSNPMSALNASSPSTLMTYLPMLAIWAAIVVGLFLLRPNSMRGGSSSSNETNKASKISNNESASPNRFRRNDDDDDSTIS